MTFESTLATLGPLVAVLAPMIGAPLGLITFYLRALRENVAQSHTALARRVDAIESTALELRRTLGEIPRDYTTKEEWLRELLHNRRVLEQVTEATIRLQATLDALVTHPSNQASRFNEVIPEQLAAKQSQSPLREQRENQNRDREGAALHVGCPPNRKPHHTNDPQAAISCHTLHTESVPYIGPGQRPGESSSK